MPEYTPERFSVNVVESLFKIDKVCVEWRVPFMALLQDLLKVKMWSPQDFPFLKPACSLRNSGSRASEILSRITLLKTLLVIDNNLKEAMSKN